MNMLGIIILGLLAAATARFTLPPLMYPRRMEIVVDQYTTLTLGCRGMELLTWTFPAARERQIDNSCHIINKINNTDRDYKFQSILIVYNMTQADVGFYHCHGQIVNFDTGLRSNRIYVYVHGDLLSVMTEQENELAVWSGYFPCRPTSPDITIDLTCDGEQFKMTPRNYSALVKHKKHWISFDPYVGFIIRNIYWVKYLNCSCHLTRDHAVSSLRFDRSEFFRALPINYGRGLVIAESPYAVNSGDNVSFQCTMLSNAIHPYYTMEFHWRKCDQNSINEKTMVNQKIFKLKPAGHVVVTTLTIKNISTADEGCFQCLSYYDIYNSKFYEEKHIFVNDTDLRHSAPRIYDPQQQEIEIMSGENITLHCEGSRPITWSGPRQNYYLFEFEDIWDKQTGRYNSVFHLERMLYSDTGFYYCHENGSVPTHSFKSDKIYIFVKDKFHLFATKYVYRNYIIPYANATVPCLATSRDIKVSLTLWGGNKQYSNRMEITNPVIHEYDPQRGFTIQMPDFSVVETLCTFRTRTFSDRKWFWFYGYDYNYNLMILMEPAITGPPEDSVFVGQTLELSCVVLARNVPGAGLRWKLPNNSSNNAWITDNIIIIEDGNLFISKLIIYDAKSVNEGRYNCSSTHDNATSTKYITVFDTFTVEEPTIQILTYDSAYVGQRLLIQCAVNVDHNIRFQMAWTISNVSDIVEMSNNTEYIQEIRHIRGQNILEIHNVTYGHVGNYTCHVNYFENGKKTRTKYVNVKKGKQVRLVADNKNLKQINVEVDEPVNLTCSAEGDPKPIITWKKDSTEVHVIEHHINISPDNTTLSIFSVTSRDVGVYACEARNLLGEDYHTVILNVSSATRLPLWAILIISIITLLTIVILMLNCRAIHRRKILSKKNMINFKFGEMENINSLLNTANGSLPYDAKWEISRNSIELGRNLGSGCFGLVVQATVSNFFDDEPVKTVAVKMLLPNSSFLDLNSLICELNILSHLGTHTNVINLLGACTKNIAERNLLVVIEYCENGSLRDNLIKNRGNFVNLINPDTELITFIPEHKDSPEDAGPSSAGDEEAALQCVSTLDLLCWALQVAQGMEFLAANKVLHGDLAVRNVLLTEKYVAKISDFGLSRNLGTDNCYKKKTECPLPIKWMALESIREKTFSTQSDVWSFGVFMWELFSLGRTPYPELETDFRFYRKLESGYRLGRPEYSTNAIHQLMLECWRVCPASRPTFRCLARTLGELLPEHARKCYTFDNQYENVWQIQNNEQVADLASGNSSETISILLENVEEDAHTSEWIELVSTV